MGGWAPQEGRVPVWVVGLLALAALLACVIGALLVWADADPYRRPPAPPGLRVSVPIWPSVHPFQVARVGSESSRPGTFLVWEESPAAGARGRGPIARFRRFEFPGGDPLEPGPAVQQAPEETALFDFDGDGVADEVHHLEKAYPKTVRVLSGADAAVLFEWQDPHASGFGPIGWGQGDWDGDGRSELAILSMRYDRSTYDWSIPDALFGARSWVSIVSWTGPQAR